MRPISSNQRWFAAAVCLLASSGFAVGQEGIVRMSDAATRTGVVRMSAMQQPLIRQTAYAANGNYQGHQFAGNQQLVQPANMYHPIHPNQAAGWAQSGHSLSTMQAASYSAGGHSLGCDSGCGTGSSCTQGCDDGSCTCYSGHCGPQGYCNSGSCDGRWDSRRGQRKMKKEGWESCDSCYYGEGYNDRMVTLFAKAAPADSCDSQGWLCRAWRGQQYNYLARNQRLSNHLFGWLVPSGCCGQGCPPFGKYCVTYADDPGYTDPRDGGHGHAGGGGGYGSGAGGQGYGVQGYGVPMSVPLAPNVRQAYNYSWGTPSSRITPMGTYNGGGAAPQQLYHQTW